MEVKNYTLHGDKANKDFDLVVYGSTGRPAIAFPEGDSSCLSWENNGMVDAVADLVDAGKVQLFCVDTSDSESWHAHGALREYRLENLEGFFAFVEGELATFIKKASGSKEPPLVLGAGMGALNATIAMLRRPKDYSGLLALSGTYDVHQLIEGELDEPWRAFSPFDLLADLTSRKAEATLLRERQLAFVCGQHGSETGADTQRQLDAAMAERDVPATFEYWGFDVSHDWYWWHEELRQFLPCLLVEGGLKRRIQDALVARAQGEASRAKEVTDQREQELADAKNALSLAKTAVKESEGRQRDEEAHIREQRDSSAKLARLAADAWAERDRIAALLSEAIQKGEAAQAQADAAAKGLADAEWIAGEARAAAQEAVAQCEAASRRVKDCEAALEEARAAQASADDALERAKRG